MRSGVGGTQESSLNLPPPPRLHLLHGDLKKDLEGLRWAKRSSQPKQSPESSRNPPDRTGGRGVLSHPRRADRHPAAPPAPRTAPGSGGKTRMAAPRAGADTTCRRPPARLRPAPRPTSCPGKPTRPGVVLPRKPAGKAGVKCEAPTHAGHVTPLAVRDPRWPRGQARPENEKA